MYMGLAISIIAAQTLADKEKKSKKDKKKLESDNPLLNNKQ